MTRTDPSVFQLPVQKLREGWYSDHYFNRTKELVSSMPGGGPNVVMQCFQREDSFAGGVDEAIAILKLCSGESKTCQRCGGVGLEHSGGSMGVPNCQACGGSGLSWDYGWDQLTVKALHEGDEIEPWEPVLQIEGPYRLFAHLETVYLGVMARRSLVMRNVVEVVEAAGSKPIWFFPARHDHWVVQTGDGMAAHQAGAASVSTHAGASWWGGKGMGTIPHALIAAYDGDTVRAARAFADRYKDESNVTVLVDFDNDSLRTALAVARELGDDLWGVRLDTSGNLVDQSVLLDEQYGSAPPTGVTPRLVELMRTELDEQGFGHVKIIVSGGFKASKIREFEDAGVPVDAYGVGSSLLRGSNDYTADIVETNGVASAKVGRGKRADSRLEIVK